MKGKMCLNPRLLQRKGFKVFRDKVINRRVSFKTTRGDYPEITGRVKDVIESTERNAGTVLLISYGSDTVLSIYHSEIIEPIYRED